MKSKHYFFLILFVLLIPNGLFAAEFQALVGIPGLTDMTGPGSLNQYINALYRLSISIAALLAVIKIVAAGAKYMLSDIITHKEDAKKDIQGALIGLLIVIGAIVILNTVNSDLTNLNLGIEKAIIEQGITIEEMIKRQQNALADRATAMGSRLVIGQCESAWGINGFDMLPGENEEQACRRVCTGPTLEGRFIDNTVGFSDQCEYIEAVAAKCDPNSNRTCCEGVRNDVWYPGHNQCLTDTNVFNQVNCTFVPSRPGSPGTGSNCSAQIAACTAAATGNRVISQREGSILCSNTAQIQVNQENNASKIACEALGRIWSNNTCQPNTSEEPVLPIGN